MKLDVAAAAKYLGVSDVRIYNLIKRERIPSAKREYDETGKLKWVMDSADLDEYVKTRRHKGTNHKRTTSESPKRKIPEKVFISTPMAGKSDFDILVALQKAAEEGDASGFAPKEAYTSGYMDIKPPKNYKHPQLWYLGRSLIKMADCDEVIFTEGWEKARGCVIERLVYDFYFKGYFNDMIADIIRGENDAKLMEIYRKGAMNYGKDGKK